ncbi:MAG: NfeD family protein [Thermoguttaceae bacterium]
MPPPSVCRRLTLLACSAALLLGLAAMRLLAAPAADANGPKAKPSLGRFISVAIPITGQTSERTRRSISRAIEAAKKQNTRLALVLEFSVPKGQKDLGRESDFAAAYALATYLSSDELDGVRTVAYLPQSIQGHAVLPVMACQEIIMAKDATLGAAGIAEKTLTPTVRSAYAEIAGRRRTLPTAIVEGLLDPAIEVLSVGTEGGVEYVTRDGLKQLRQHRATNEPVVIKRAGEQGELSGNELRQRALIKYLAADRRDVARALDLPPTAIAHDPSLEGGWRPVRIDLKGPIRFESINQVERMVKEQVEGNNANFICLWIDSPGGSLVDAMRLANTLADLDPNKVLTVAYVPSEARGDAAAVALACDQLVVGPRAILGGPGADEPTPEAIRAARQTIRDALSKEKGRGWSLWAALVDPHLSVYRAKRPGDVEYFSDEELEAQPDRAKWQKESLVTDPGRPLQLTGEKAADFDLANRVVDDFAQFRRLYGLEDEPALVEPGWADVLIRAMAAPGVAAILLLIGFAGLYIELHSPGTGIGAFVAVVCFLLFFWSHYLGGTAGWLQITLFVAGVACLLLELFVIPGFGIFGLGGGIMVLASIVLASQTWTGLPKNEYQLKQLETSLLTVAVAAAGVIAFAILLRHRLPRSRFLGNMMLEPPAGDEAETIRRREALVDFHELIGARGFTTTQLTPSGKARFGDALVDVLADGEVIGRGATVEVIKVQGNRILVREVDRGKASEES